MTKEELLKPRWKVIADYPGMLYEVGDIIPAYDNGVAYIVEGDSYSMIDFPALFKKLEWWEERTQEQMPEYIKDSSDGVIYKLEYRNRAAFIEYRYWVEWVAVNFGSHVTPATQEEYETAINKL